jgi:hypothetical protein
MKVTWYERELGKLWSYIHTYMHHTVIITASPSHVAPLFVTSCTLSSPSTTVGTIKGGLGVLGSRIVRYRVTAKNSVSQAEQSRKIDYLL